MKLSKIYAILCLAAVAGCTQNPQKNIVDKLNKTAATASPEQINLQYSDPIIIQNSDYVMYALPIGNNTGRGSGIFKSVDSRSESNWNMIFYNPKTREYHLLDEKRKMIINLYEREISYAKPENGGKQVNETDSLLFYSVIVADYDKDGKLTSDDPEYLFVSDRQGNAFRQISPDNFRVTAWKTIKNSGKILISTIKDSNNDKKFDDKDETVPFVYDLKTGKLAVPVFGKEFNAKVSKLFNEQWNNDK